MAQFTLKYGPINSVSGSTEEWGVRTIGQAINHPTAKTVLRHPDSVTAVVSTISVGNDHPITDGMIISLQKTAASKG